MIENQIIQKSVETFLKKPLCLEVEFTPERPAKWYLRLFNVKPKPIQRKFYVLPPKIGTKLRISSKILNIPGNIFAEGLNNALWKAAEMNSDDLVYILACCIQNDRNEPSEELIEFIKWNFDDDDVCKALESSLGLINVESFMKSMVLLKSANVLTPKTSPTS